MSKKYNVWLSIEEIDEGKDENGNDIDAEKIFVSEERIVAEDFVGTVMNLLAIYDKSQLSEEAKKNAFKRYE